MAGLQRILCCQENDDSVLIALWASCVGILNVGGLIGTFHRLPVSKQKWVISLEPWTQKEAYVENFDQ